MIKTITTAILGFSFIYLLAMKEYYQATKKVVYTQTIVKDSIDIFEDNFDSTWQVFGCIYYGWKK